VAAVLATATIRPGALAATRTRWPTNKTLAPAANEEPIAEHIILLEDLIAQVEQLAPLPGVARHVIQVTDSEDLSANNLSSVLATDAALTANLLRLGNSAFYGYPRRIATVRDAVALIGYRDVRSTAIATAIMEVCTESKGGPFNIDLFWGHSIAAGVIWELLAKRPVTPSRRTHLQRTCCMTSAG
jgi:HD-like signal output (HDOD) protein